MSRIAYCAYQYQPSIPVDFHPLCIRLGIKCIYPILLNQLNHELEQVRGHQCFVIFKHKKHKNINNKTYFLSQNIKTPTQLTKDVVKFILFNLFNYQNCYKRLQRWYLKV